MDLPESRAAVNVLEILAESPSTNDALVAHATGDDAGAWPDLSVVVTDTQTAGRGRLGRTWVSPAGRSLAISLLLRPQTADGSALATGRYGWFPLLAGLAMTRAVSSVVAESVALKWPNDVLVGDLKICGILGELLPDAAGLVIGAGLNVDLRVEELPTPTSTSLTLRELVPGAPAAPDALADAVLASYLTTFGELYADFLLDERGAARLRDLVTERCETIGRSVRVELPSGAALLGTATAIDSDGRLVVETNTGITTVAAGDVTHLRY